MSIVCEGTLDLEKVGKICIVPLECCKIGVKSDGNHSIKAWLNILKNLQANMWLGTLLTEQSEDIYRMKGLLAVDGMDERFVFQVITPIKSASNLNFISPPANYLL